MRFDIQFNEIPNFTSLWAIHSNSYVFTCDFFLLDFFFIQFNLNIMLWLCEIESKYLLQNNKYYSISNIVFPFIIFHIIYGY